MPWYGESRPWFPWGGSFGSRARLCALGHTSAPLRLGPYRRGEVCLGLGRCWGAQAVSSLGIIGVCLGFGATPILLTFCSGGHRA